ncbi:hypothetical protein SpCBS45565_g08301 [Spizellomyces sp. 'palustris']|nr:hypothetical protein SpCBS45565_g08301 [Spizellomyces sp. 'palustris']
MSNTSTVDNTCDVPADVIEAVKAFRFRSVMEATEIIEKSKTNAALILKIDVPQLKVVIDELLEDSSIEDISDALPDTTPRFLVMSFELRHKDGRVSYPLFGVYYNPAAASTANRMLYASTKNYLYQRTDISGKVFDLTDSEDLTEEWLVEQLESSKTRP